MPQVSSFILRNLKHLERFHRGEYIVPLTLDQSEEIIVGWYDNSDRTVIGLPDIVLTNIGFRFQDTEQWLLVPYAQIAQYNVSKPPEEIPYLVLSMEDDSEIRLPVIGQNVEQGTKDTFMFGQFLTNVGSWKLRGNDGGQKEK